MVRINLLPWREIRRKERERLFYSVAAGSAVLMGLVVFYAHIHINGLIDGQRTRNQFLEKEITEVDKRIREIKELESQKKKLLARMKVIQQLQSSRPVAVHLFDEIVKTIPDGVYLTALDQKGSNITLTGIAQSNARVSAFMRNLDTSQWLGNPKLDVIERTTQGRQRSSKFTLQASQITEPEATEKEK